jgi:hypothetical protein
MDHGFLTIQVCKCILKPPNLDSCAKFKGSIDQRFTVKEHYLNPQFNIFRKKKSCLNLIVTVSYISLVLM